MSPRDSDIAIVGHAGRFPGADSVAALWQNLERGVESIQSFDAATLRSAGVPAALLALPAFVPRGAVLSDIESFDAEFFGLRPREAELTDPQRRLLLELAWHALEDAGFAPGDATRRIGVFVGTGSNDYFLRHVLPRLREDDPELHQALLGAGSEFLATRIAYHLDLHGPALTLQTACSSSLAAVHLACQAILGGECDLALAGGVSLRVPQVAGYLYQPGMVQSPDGHCRAFDAGAAGTVGGSGAGLVVLQRLEAALQDGADVRAVIRGSALNNDGSRKGGYAAPSVEGQRDAIREALAVADVDADSVDYVEAHGTATALGDLVEAEALRRALCERRSRPLWLGSVKTNLGHLDAAAGVAGLIKAALAVAHGRLPASLHCDTPSVQDPLRVVRESMAWPSAGGPRRAGVSSFGIGGTNVHVVLEQPPVSLADPAPPGWQVLRLSARTPAALQASAQALAAHLDAHPELALADVAHTLQVGRRRFECRRALVADSLAAAISGLRSGAGWTQLQRSAPPALAFQLPAATAVVPEACWRALHAALPAFARAFDAAGGAAGPPLRTLLAVASGLLALWSEWGVGDAGLAQRLETLLHGPLDFETLRTQLMALQPDVAADALRLPLGPAMAGESLVCDPFAGSDPVRALLGGLGRLWTLDVAGLTTAASDPMRRRVPLPPYPFERRRFWIDAPGREAAEAPANPALLRNADPADWFYTPAWVRQERPRGVPLVPGRALLVGDISDLSAALAAALTARGWQVEAGATAAVPADVRLVIHVGNLGPADEDTARIRRRGCGELLELVQEIGPRAQPPLTWVLTSGLLRVTGGEPLAPERALGLGIVKVAPAEYRGLQIGALDVEWPANDSERAWLAAALAEEIAAAAPAQPLLALRPAGRFVELLAPVRLPAAATPLREHTAYLVTGGLGGIGFVLAEHLARTWRARLVLVGRQARADDPRIAALHAAGAEVMLEAADVADRAAMAGVIARARARFGHLGGVVHAAGLADHGGVIHRRDAASLDAVLAARVDGTRLLVELLADDPPDFLLLCSSLGTAIPRAKFGQVAYAAGTEFLDAFCQGRPRVLTLDWSDWAEVGMSVAARARLHIGGLAAQALPLVGNLSNADGVLAFERALGSGLSRVLVSPENLTRLTQAFARLVDDAPAALLGAATPALTRESVAALWQEALGVTTLGFDDDFFEHGGDSLLAVTLAESISRSLGVALAPHQLLDHPTVARLTAHLQASRPAGAAATPLVTLQAGDGSAPPLFLVHPIGGHVLVYRDLVRALGAARTVYGLQARGLMPDTAPDESVEAMAGAYLDCIQAQQPIGPVSLAGASFGGVVAFEIATRLAAAGRAVALTMIDAPAPGFAPEAEQDDAAIVARAVHALFKVSVDADALRALDAGARARLVAAAAAQAGEPLDLGADLLGRLIDVWRANHRALTRYRPAAVYPGAVRFFRPTLLEPGNRLDHDHHWRQFVSGPLEVMIVPGDHTTMNQWPNTRSILLAVPAE